MTALPPPVGYVVAGGRSRRMGQDKATLPWRHSTLLSDAVHRLRQATTDVRVLSGTDEPWTLSGLHTVRDVEPLLGPLGALRTALEDAAPRGVLFLAVDLPFVPVALLRRLIVWSVGFDAVVPHSVGTAEPLAAFYSSACLDPVCRRLGAGDRRMSAFWPDVQVRHVDPTELADLGDPARIFANLNTQEDVERWRT